MSVTIEDAPHDAYNLEVDHDPPHHIAESAMTRDEFLRLFEVNICRAIADELGDDWKYGGRSVKIELHGAGHAGDLMSVKEAASLLYIGECI